MTHSPNDQAARAEGATPSSLSEGEIEELEQRIAYAEKDQIMLMKVGQIRALLTSLKQEREGKDGGGALRAQADLGGQERANALEEAAKVAHDAACDFLGRKDAFVMSGPMGMALAIVGAIRALQLCAGQGPPAARSDATPNSKEGEK